LSSSLWIERRIPASPSAAAFEDEELYAVAPVEPIQALVEEAAVA